MHKIISIKTLLLLSVLSLGDMRTSIAMEWEDDSDEEGKRPQSITKTQTTNDSKEEKPEYTSSLSSSHLSPIGKLQFFYRACTQLIDQAESESTPPEQKIRVLNDCLSYLLNIYNSFQQAQKRSQVSLEETVYILESFYKIRLNIFLTWGNYIPLHGEAVHEHFPVHLETFIEIDNFVYTQAETLPQNTRSLLKLGLGSNAQAYHNFLVAIVSYLSNYKDRIQAVNKFEYYFNLASKYFSLIKDDKKFGQLGAENYKIIQDIYRGQQKGNDIQNPKISATLGKKLQNLKRQRVIDEERERLNTALNAQSKAGVYNFAADFLLLTNMIDKSFYVWANNKKDVSLYHQKAKEAYGSLLSLEQKVAEKLKLNTNSANWTPEDYAKIYKELEVQLSLNAVKVQLPNFMIIGINSNDWERCNARMGVYAKIFGGSANSFEEIPNVFKRLFAILKYFQGDPGFWELYTQNIKQKMVKNREANRKKKIEKVADKIRSERSAKEAQPQEKEVFKQEQKEEKDSQKKIDLPPSKPISAVPQISLIEEKKLDSLAVESKRAAQEVLLKQETKKQKKGEKNHEIDETLSKSVSQTPNIAPIQVPAQSTLKIAINNNTKKLYENLYNTAPRLSSEDAVKLLEGFGLTVSPGKGSHKVGTFCDGEMITDLQGNEVWSFPDFEDLQIAIPKWKGKDILDYMVKNLKHILEKIGARLDSSLT